MSDRAPRAEVVSGASTPADSAAWAGSCRLRPGVAERLAQREDQFGAAFPARVRRATAAAKQRFTIQAGRFLRHEEYDVLQLLLCDPAGVYPDEPECAPGFDVPLA